MRESTDRGTIEKVRRWIKGEGHCAGFVMDRFDFEPLRVRQQTFLVHKKLIRSPRLDKPGERLQVSVRCTLTAVRGGMYFPTHGRRNRRAVTNNDFL